MWEFGHNTSQRAPDMVVEPKVAKVPSLPIQFSTSQRAPDAVKILFLDIFVMILFTLALV
jgi:hypothetical protein